MQIIPQFDPTAATSGSFRLNMPNGGWVVVTNESVVGLQLRFGDGSMRMVNPFTIRAMRVTVTQVGCDWQQLYSITGAQAPQGLNLVTGETYDPEEWSGGEFILSLPRLVNVGNQSTGGTVNSLINDGNAAGTQIVESTATGSPGSNVLIDNDGTVHIKVLSNGAYVEVLAIVPGTATTAATITLGAAGFASGQLDPSSTTAGSITNFNTIPGMVYKTQQGGAAQGHVFGVWNGTSNVVPFSVGGQFAGAPAFVDASGNVKTTGNLTVGPAVSGAQAQLFYSTGINAVQVNAPQAGAAAQGVSFGSWDGAAGHIPFSVGGQFNGAVASVDNSGNYVGPAGGGIPTTRNGAALSVPVFTGLNTPLNPPTGSIWIKK